MNDLSISRDAGYSELKDYVVESTGLAYYQTRDQDFEERIDRRLRRLGITGCRTYLTLLRDHVLGQTELDHLIAELTIGETFFFRDENQFNAIRRLILPDLIERQAARKSLRVWSAGCASGAEAYSLSIVLRDEFRERILNWETSILGTDVNRRVLEQARAGSYDKWALRTTPDDIRERCFRLEGTRWRIADRYRLGVDFQYHNLVKSPAVSWSTGLFAFDLVLCRNVMIYFDRPTAARVVERLHESMRPGAWLVVGHADHDPNTFRNFDVISHEGVSVYRKQGGTDAVLGSARAADFFRQVPAENPLNGPEPCSETFLATAPDLDDSRSVHDVPSGEATGPDGPDAGRRTLADVRALADSGASVHAETLCSALIEESPLDPLPHFYQALILEQRGRADEAERSLRRSLYLDRSSALAHYHLGLLLRRSGRLRGARQHFENVMALLADLDDAKEFEAGDGMRAGDLRAMAEMNLEGL